MKKKDSAVRWGLALFLTVGAILLFYDTLFGRRVLPSFGAHQITIFGFFHCNSRFPCLDFYLSESGFQNQQIKNGLCLLAGRIKPAFTAPDADAELFKKLFGVLFGKLFENP